jgi:type VI secretion system protein ImpA
VLKISAFIDPLAPATEQAPTEVGGDSARVVAEPAGVAPTTLAQAKKALAAIADYYSRLEPSSPTLPLVRQAHQLIGKSFIEVMKILIPGQLDKAAFQIGGDQVFDLPVGRLSEHSAVAPENLPAGSAAAGDSVNGPAGYNVTSRAQAIALLEQVQRFFRATEPSSPVPMLCERARALAERDFMGVLREVLPKAALKNPGT